MTRWHRQDQNHALRVPAFEEQRVHQTDLGPAQTMEASSEGASDALSAAVQLPSYLCDNMLNVQHEPRIHRSATWPQRPNVADDVCALAQLKLRLGGAGKAPDWYQNGIRQKRPALNY